MAASALQSRELYPGTSRGVHLDAAGISLVSSAASEAVAAFLAEAEEDPGGAHHGTRLDDARAAAARLVGARPHQIALITSTSAALNLVAEAIEVGRGDNVVTSALEFISLVAPFRERCLHAGAELRVAESDDGRLPPERVLERVDARTRAVVLSSVVWTTGYRLELEAIGRECRRLGVPLVVDAIQQLGVVPFDVEQLAVDVVVSGGHKWLGSPSGMGLLFATDEFCAEHTLPLPYAPTALEPGEDWLSLWRQRDFSPVRDFPQPAGARKFEVGCHHAAMSACGLAASLGVIEAAGVGAVHEHSVRLGNQVAEELAGLGLEVVTDLDEAHRSGITTFRARTARDDAALSELLREQGIVTAVRYTNGTGGVRVSCHLYNDAGDVDALVGAVREWLAARPTPRQ